MDPTRESGVATGGMNSVRREVVILVKVARVAIAIIAVPATIVLLIAGTKYSDHTYFTPDEFSRICFTLGRANGTVTNFPMRGRSVSNQMVPPCILIPFYMLVGVGIVHPWMVGASVKMLRLSVPAGETLLMLLCLMTAGHFTRGRALQSVEHATRACSGDSVGVLPTAEFLLPWMVGIVLSMCMRTYVAVLYACRPFLRRTDDSESIGGAAAGRPTPVDTSYSYYSYSEDIVEKSAP
jgi:hypothetical protein